MVRLLGHTLLNKKKIYIALTSIYGIGIVTSKKILKDLNIDPELKVINVPESKFSDLRKYLENSNIKLEENLKRYIATNIRRLKEVNSYRGKRHLKGLPVRGQRTRTNNRTSRRLFISKN
jgi:small subunit ribosomal protein S13